MDSDVPDRGSHTTPTTVVTSEVVETTTTRRILVAIPPSFAQSAPATPTGRRPRRRRRSEPAMSGTVRQRSPDTDSSETETTSEEGKSDSGPGGPPASPAGAAAPVAEELDIPHVDEAVEERLEGAIRGCMNDLAACCPNTCCGRCLRHRLTKRVVVVLVFLMMSTIIVWLSTKV